MIYDILYILSNMLIQKIGIERKIINNSNDIKENLFILRKKECIINKYIKK